MSAFARRQRSRWADTKWPGMNTKLRHLVRLSELAATNLKCRCCRDGALKIVADEREFLRCCAPGLSDARLQPFEESRRAKASAPSSSPFLPTLSSPLRS